MPDCYQPDDCREDREHREYAADQHELVMRAEGADGEVLDGGRGEIDRHLADRDDRRAVRASEPGGQLANPNRHGSGQDAGDHAAAAPGT